MLVFVFWVKAAVVEVTPEAASLQAKLSLADGWGWVQRSQVFLLSPEASLEVAAPGFIAEKIALQRDTIKRRVIVELKEAPAIIMATATPADERTQWRLDAKRVSSGAKLYAAVEAGSHSLTVTHPHHQPQTLTLNLERGEEKTLEFALKPVRGQLNISSKPEGAPVLLDDRPIGKTPISMAQAGGNYRLRIETADFETVNDTIDISYQNQVADRDYQLRYKKASINFRLAPPDGQLMIDGKTISTKDMPVELEPNREIIINYSKAGWLSRTIKRTLKPQQKEDISLSLKAEFGEVVIKASPQADIKINNKPAGQTPQTITLRALSHSVHLSRPGYRAIQKTIRPDSRRTVQINETLLTERQASQAESPAVYKNSIGIELALFTPQKTAQFQLGAHRSEKGQRANEILRAVSLDKDFYVSRTEISARHYHAFDKQTPASNVALNNVSWEDAALFCNWLSARENLERFYVNDGGRIVGYNPHSVGYRLLSEAEWEWLARYAKRGASVMFIWGNSTTIPKGAGNLADESAKKNVSVYIPGYNDGYPQLAPVASFKRDRAGLHDMAGNLSEWVHDVYATDQVEGVLSNPLGTLNNTGFAGHVVKGSSWRSGSLPELRSAYRQRATGRADNIGFRIARYIY